MNKYLNLLTTVFLLVAMVFSSVSAVDYVLPVEPGLEITNVQIGGVDLSDEDIYAPVYLNSEVEVEVEWKSYVEDEAKIVVEFDGEEVDTEYFDTGLNWHGKRVLTIEIDDDEDLLEGKQPVTIKMRNRDGNIVVSKTIYLDISKEKHLVEIYDVNFRQGVEFEAGQPVTASIGVVNNGAEKEEDIYVEMSIPELGLVTRTNRFDLYTEEQYDADDDDDYKVHKDLFLALPVETPAGVYDVYIKVVYNDGETQAEDVYSIVVGSGAVDYESQVTIDTTYIETRAGSGIFYTVYFENPNVDYNVEVEGAENLGTVKVTEEEGTAFVYVALNEDLTEGSYPFKIIVKAGNNIVKEFDVETRVVDYDSGVSYSNVKQGLEIGFAILLVILVILGIVLVAKKLGKGDEIEEPVLDDDQTYY